MDAPDKKLEGTGRVGSSQILGQRLAASIVAVDDHQRIMALSPSAAKMLDLRPDQALHQSVEFLRAALHVFHAAPRLLSRIEAAAIVGQSHPHARIAIVDAGRQRDVPD